MQHSGWQYDMRLHELRAAHWWGCPSPGHFDRLSKDERLDILAAFEASWKMDVVNQYEQAEKAKHQINKRPVGRGRRRR